MRVPTVRYESAFNNFFTKPFEIGMRHLKVAFCDGSPTTLLKLAKERIIYRPPASINTYRPLTTEQRISHGVIGTLETAGYTTLIVPFVVAAADRFFNKPRYPKGGYPFRTHMEEGGKFDANPKDWRKNPFDPNAIQDPFYQGASFLLKAQQASPSLKKTPDSRGDIP